MYNRKHLYEWDTLDSSYKEETINRLPESRLWKAVVVNAISDALSKPNSKYCKMNKINAQSWILKDDVNFYRVCDLAGLSSGEIRSKIKPLLNRH